MKKIGHIFEVIVGLLNPMESALIGASIQTIKSEWINNFFLEWIVRPIFILLLHSLDMLLFVLSFLLLVDGIQGLFTEESFIPHLKEQIEEWFDREN